MRPLATLPLLLALLLAVPASAQTEFLLKGGLNTAFFSGADANGLDPRLGVVAGAGVRLAVAPQLGIQLEALYSQEGAVEDDGSGRYELDYLDLPVLLRADLPAGLNRLGVYAGPQVGIPLRSVFKPDIGPAEDEQARTDVGLALGADFGAGPISIDARYVLGLNDALDDEIAGEPVTPLSLRNQTVSFTLVYTFGGGRRY